MVEVGGVVRVDGRAFRAAVAVRDRGRAELGRGIDAGAEVRVGRRGRLDEEDVARGTDRRDHVEVERDLARPARVRGGQRAGAGLADLLEAAVRRGAGGQAVLGAVDGEVRLCVRVVIRVDDRDGEDRRGRGREVVHADHVRRAEPARGGRGVGLEAVVGHANLRVATRLPGSSRAADSLVRVTRHEGEIGLSPIVDFGRNLAGACGNEPRDRRCQQCFRKVLAHVNLQMARTLGIQPIGPIGHREVGDVGSALTAIKSVGCATVIR